LSQFLRRRGYSEAGTGAALLSGLITNWPTSAPDIVEMLDGLVLSTVKRGFEKTRDVLLYKSTKKKKVEFEGSVRVVRENPEDSVCGQCGVGFFSFPVDDPNVGG